MFIDPDLLQYDEVWAAAVVRQRGSHVMMRPGSAGCVVSLHREIKRGTLGGILRQAGVDAEMFIQARLWHVWVS